MVSYKLDNYWSKFTTVEPNPNMPEKVNLYKKLELTSNARIPNSPDMFIGKGGSLIVNGNNPQAFGKFSQHLSIENLKCHHRSSAVVRPLRPPLRNSTSLLVQPVVMAIGIISACPTT